MVSELDHESQSLAEEAADELARLDLTCTHAPTSASLSLWFLALTELTGLTEHSRSVLLSLVAAEGDALHDAALQVPALRWRTVLAEAERRSRGGAPISSSRFSEVVPSLATYRNRARLEAIWRESGRGRPVLLRALDSAAWFPNATDREDEGSAIPDRENPAAREEVSRFAGDASAALLLCAGGRTDRVRALPFVTVPAVVRADAIEAWRGGEVEPWARAGLSAFAHRARHLREAVRALIEGVDHESESVASMGRAGISAGRALTVARRRFVMTMPSLADELELSRPAATAALDRLVEAGLLREVTGRARDRVYAYTAALAIAEGALPS